MKRDETATDDDESRQRQADVGYKEREPNGSRNVRSRERIAEGDKTDAPESASKQKEEDNKQNLDTLVGRRKVDRSRRDFLRASAVTGIGALGIGTVGTAAGATRSAKECGGGSLDINENFRLLDNQWGNPAAEQCVWTNEDGSYGWDFDASNTTSGINYPEVFIGTRPWGSDLSVPEFPIQRRDLSEFVLDIDAEYEISGGEWDWTQEWWLMEEPPSVQTKTYQYEVMLLLDWGGGHDHGSPVATDLWTDRFGNTIDLWALYDSGGTSATFYIFRVQGGHDGGKVDVKRISDWLTNHEGVSEDLWISGSELGNEYWPGAAGQNTLKKFTVTINGSTYTSVGSSDSVEQIDSTPPDAPSSLVSPSHDDSTVALDWSASMDSGGSDLAEYVVYVNGEEDHRIDAGTTSSVVSGLSADTTTEFTVTAVDGAGNESASSNKLSVTTDNTPEPVDVQNGAVYRIENVSSSMVLDVEGDSTSDGTTLLQQEWTGVEAQRWIVRDNDDGTYHLESKHSGKVADVEGGATNNGANVLQWSWHGGDNQRWNVIDNGDGTHRFENEHSGLVLDIDSAISSDGANARQWDWTGDAGQRWYLSRIDTDSTAPSAPAGLSSTSHDETTVALEWDASTDSGGSGVTEYIVYVDGSEDHRLDAETTATTVSGLSPGTMTEFAVTATDGAGNESPPSNAVSVTTENIKGEDSIQSGTVYRIENAGSGLTLDVKNASTADGATILQWPWNGNGNQRWILRDNGDGTYHLESKHSGKVADVEGGATNNGANVLQWSWHGGDNQRWNVIDNGDGTHRFENEHSGLVLTVEGDSTADGANVQQAPWDGRNGQRWTLRLPDS
jgi:chitodextrinase